MMVNRLKQRICEIMSSLYTLIASLPVHVQVQ